jgi:hypothetical protein
MFALATAPSASASSDPPTVGTVTTTISGVPSHLTVGGAFEPTLTITSTSADSIEVIDVCAGMWNTAQDGFSQTAGINVEWQDPSTGAWVASSKVASNGEWTLDRSGGVITIPPYGTVSVQAHVTMTDAALRGTEHIDANGVCAYAIIDSSGTNVPGALDYNFPQTAFSYGTLNSVRSTPSTNQPTYSPAYSPPAASPVDTPVVVATPPPAGTTPAAVPSPPPSPSAEQTSASADTSPAAPSPTGSKLAFNATTGGSTGSGMDAVPLTVTAAALLTFAGAAIILHRKRGSDGAADGE